MNPDNYASLEASKRLVDAGIVLETDVYHCPIGLKDGNRENRSPGNVVYELRQADGRFHCGLHKDYYKRCIPAPSMTEVWRELPDEVMLDKEDNITIAGLAIYGFESAKNTNPTDALIDLLIFVTEQRKEGVIEFRHSCIDTHGSCCDFCKFYDFNGEDGVYVDKGFCHKHNRKSDPGNECEDFCCWLRREKQ